MSLITLRSSQNNNGATISESAALLSNYFKEGIPLHPGNTLELVSMSITKLDKFNIIQGQNDTLIWRIGAGPGTVGGVPLFSQHQITVPGGSYNGSTLAAQIAILLNESTLLGNYRGKWTCVYQKAIATASSSFTINYGQNTIPGANGETVIWDSFGGTSNPTFTKESTYYNVTWPTLDVGLNLKSDLRNMIYGDRSLYPNGGEFQMNILPVKDMTDVDLVGSNLISNWTPTNDFSSVWTEPGNLPNNWEYVVAVPDGGVNAIETFSLPGDHGGLLQVTITNAGSQYVAASTGTFTSSSGIGADATYRIGTVGATGDILSFSLIVPGGGYNSGDTLSAVPDSAGYLNLVNGNTWTTTTSSLRSINFDTTSLGFSTYRNVQTSSYKDLTTGNIWVQGANVSTENFYKTNLGSIATFRRETVGSGVNNWYEAVDATNWNIYGPGSGGPSIPPSAGQATIATAVISGAGILTITPTGGGSNIVLNPASGSTVTIETITTWFRTTGATTWDVFETLPSESSTSDYTANANLSTGVISLVGGTPGGGSTSYTPQVGTTPSIVVGSGAVLTVSSVSSTDGTNYSSGNTGNLVGGTGSGATYEIDAIGPNGSVTAVRVTNLGSDYTAKDILTLEGSDNNAKLRILTVATEVNNYFAVLASDGVIGFADNSSSDANSDANWNKNRMIYNVSTNKFGGSNNIGNLNIAMGKNLTIPTSEFTPVLTSVGYPEVRMGRSRDQLIQGITEYPGNADAQINSTASGQDISIHITNNAAGDNIGVQINGFSKSPGTLYPINGWRQLKDYTNIVQPNNWDSLASTPARWTTFKYGVDQIRIRLEQYGVRNNRYFISHDDSENGLWSEEVMLIQTADNSNVAFTSTVRERLYPYCPSIAVSRGTRFESASYQLYGTFDTERISDVPGLIGSKNSNGVLHLEEEEDLDPSNDINVDSSGPQADLTLTYLLKTGIIPQDLVVVGPVTGNKNTVSDRSVLPNEANLSFILGLDSVYTFNVQKANNEVQTNDLVTPETSIQEPSLHVELPDFNIRSYSGESGDTGRAIAVIPKEQWTTDAKTGTLQYVAPYPIPIDLNVQSSIVLNEINARLREPNGRIADDLINPTEICLRLTESDESKQQRVMDKAIRQLSSIQSNIQDNKISNFNNNMPLL